MSDLKSRIAAVHAKLDAREADEATRSIVGSGSQPTRIGNNSDEQKLLRTFRAKDLRSLLEINTCAPAFKHVSDADKYQVIEMKKTFDVARFTRQIFAHETRDPELGDSNNLPPVRGVLDSRYAKNQDLKSLVRAFSSSGVGDGDEWVPTVLSSNYVEEYELERKLAAAIKELPMTSSPWEMPVQTDVTRARLIGEGAAITDVNFGTDKLTFSARKLGEYFLLPEELNEDSAPAILELARSEIVQSQVRAIEDALLNGDNTAAHMDSDVVLADSNRKAWKGLRKLALAASSTVGFAGGAASEQLLSDMRKLGGKYMVNPKQVAWIVGPSVYAQLLQLPSVTTLEKFGPQYTAMSGALAVYQGMPIIVSEFIREDLNASAVFDGVTTNRSSILLANVTRLYMGRRRPIRVRVQQDARLEFDRWQLASYQRLDFQTHKQAGTAYASGSISAERSIVLGINVLS